MIYMFDTNVIGYLVRGSSLALKRRFESGKYDTYAISAVVYAEILYGLRKINENKIALKIKTFLENLRIVEFNTDAAEMYAKIRADLEKSGTPIDNMDLLIAASAMAEKAILVSHNTRHFLKVKDLNLEDWF